MSTLNLPPFILRELPDITEAINFPLKSTHRIKYTCFDVSKSLIAFGATSGGIYIFNRNPCEFVQLIPNKDGAVTKLAISHDERFISIANGRGMVMVTECAQALSGGHSSVTSKEHHGNEVTCMAWGKNNLLFSADDVGKVSVLQLQNFITKSMFTSSSQTIMSLDSRVCQLDVRSTMLLVSTLTRTYICDTSLEQYRQIGQKLRDGDFGACFIDTMKHIENGITTNNDHDITEVKKYNIIDDAGSAFGKDVKNALIYCARPGSRLWEATVDGEVKRTHQFKQILGQQPLKFTTIESYNHEKVSIEKLSKESDGQSLNFSKILSINGAIFSFKKDAIYLLNLHEVDNTIWSNTYKDIVDCKINHDTIYMWLSNGTIINLKYTKIDKFLVKCFADKKYVLCAELCALYNEYFTISPVLSSKLHILIGLRDKIENKELLDKIEKILLRFDTLKSNEAKQSGIQMVENTYSAQLEDSNSHESIVNEKGNESRIDDRSYSKMSPEALIALKDITISVSDKLNTSKKILKEKWGDFEEKMKHLSIDKTTISDTNNKDDTHSNESDKIVNDFKTNGNEDKNDTVDQTPVVFESDIVYKESSQNAIEIDNNSVETDNVCKLLYKYYRLSLVSTEIEGTNLVTIIDDYACDIERVQNLMLLLEEYCISVGGLEESKFLPNNIFLSYLSQTERKDELLNSIIENESLYKYFVDSCICVNMKTQKLSNLGCECGYPLPFNRTNKTPAFVDLIDDFIEKQWSRKTRSQCYEMCKKMPYLWRKILYLRRNEDLLNVLKLLLQMLDENLLHSFLPQFTIDTWERTIQLYATLHDNRCLNCNKIFNHISVKDMLSWEDLGGLITKTIGGRNAIKIMEKYADLIEMGALSIKFYHTAMLVAMYEKYETMIRSQLVDVLLNAYDFEEPRTEICKLLRSTANGKLRHTALPICVAANSTKWGLNFLPETTNITKKRSTSDQNDIDIRTSESTDERSEIKCYLTLEEILENLDKLGNTDCTLCGLPLHNKVLIRDGGLWVFKCGHTYHGSCLNLIEVIYCPNCAPNKI